MNYTRFHSFHGRNVDLSEDGTVACRNRSFADALCFSRRPLSPGEIFLVEIEEAECGWSGHMRIGLTLLNPDRKFTLPPYALPDLVRGGRSWIKAVTQSTAWTQPDMDGDEVVPVVQHFPDNCMCFGGSSSDTINTGRGPISRSLLEPTLYSTVLPTDVGSRIGVMFLRRSVSIATMHFVINGHSYGPGKEIHYPTGSDDPLARKNLYAVVDVYGSTKKVRVLQLYGVESLQSMCRQRIVQSMGPDELYRLQHIPPKMREFLLNSY